MGGLRVVFATVGRTQIVGCGFFRLRQKPYAQGGDGDEERAKHDSKQCSFTFMTLGPVRVKVVFNG